MHNDSANKTEGGSYTAGSTGTTFAGHGGPLMPLMSEGDAHARVRERAAHAPRIYLTQRQVCDLELLLVGAFSPLSGFMTEKEYRSVVDTMRLPDGGGPDGQGTLWPMPIVLDVAEANAPAEGSEVALCDQYGRPLALMTVTSVYTPDKQHEAEAVYGTTDTHHFGVRMLFEHTLRMYVGGPVQGLGLPEYYDFLHLRRTPMQVREVLAERGSERVVAFQTRNPLHRAHVELIRRAAADHDAHALIHPVVGMTKDGDIDYVTRVRSYEQLVQKRLSDTATLSLLPLAMRMGGPREALWHAIIRKNHGATHFIIGRDHAGPGKNAQGEPFYDPFAAQELVREHEAELGMTIVPMPEMVYVEERGGYAPRSELAAHETVWSLSGTEVREKLARGDDIPEWFSYPEVVAELRRAMQKSRGFTLFFTGLSGAGKSTIAQYVRDMLTHTYEKEVTFLDGDVIRQHLSYGLGFSREDRNTNIERIGFVAGEVTRHGGIAICSAIAPYADARAKNRERITSLGGAYIEIFVSTPISVCRERDPKGLYRKADSGEITGFTGIDDPYEAPEDAEVVIDTTRTDPEAAARTVIGYLAEAGLLS